MIATLINLKMRANIGRAYGPENYGLIARVDLSLHFGKLGFALTRKISNRKKKLMTDKRTSINKNILRAPRKLLRYTKKLKQIILGTNE